MKKIYTCLLSAALLTTGAAKAETLTVYPDATGTSTTLPFNIYYASNQDLHSQMVYPATQLTALKGQVIDKIAFNLTRIGNGDWNCKGLTVKMGTTTQSEYAGKDFITEGLSVVADLEAFTLSKDLTLPAKWEITLTTPFTYTGDNLVIDIMNTKDNGPRYWTFQGEAQDTYTGLSMTNSVRQEKFLPTIIIDYSSAASVGATLSAAEVAFPLEFVGDDSQATVKLTNTGTEALSGTVSVEGDAFEVSPTAVTALAGGESLDLTVDFKPAAQGKYTGTLTVALEGVEPMTVALSGMAVEGPSAVRTIFNAKNYDEAVPAGWNAYAEEYAVQTGELTGSTTMYDEFGTILRFDSANVGGYSAMVWNHGNPVPNTDLYERYYYVVSPIAGGEFVLGGTLYDEAITGAYIKAFSATYDANDGRFVIGDEIALTWDTPLAKGSWSVCKGETPASTQIALLLKYSAINFFASEAKVDGIGNIQADPTAPAEYYNLQGVRVDNPARGIYIRRQGGKATKVVIR